MKESTAAHNLRQQGFALVATLSIVALITMIAMAMLSLSTLETRIYANTYYFETAKANARLALTEAVAALQESLGKDQAVCAEAAIYESHDDPSTTTIDESTYVNNRHWLGAWKTTFTQSNKEWPIVGKKSDNTSSTDDSPYTYRSIYTDLRSSIPNLQTGKWKTELLARWLVSGGDQVLHTHGIKPDLVEGVELVGNSSLGQLTRTDKALSKETSLYLSERVVAPLSSIVDSEGNTSGRYAYWVTNNNTRANIVQSPDKVKTSSIRDEISSNNDPGALTSISNSTHQKPFDTFVEDNKKNFAKVITNSTLQLASDIEAYVLKQKFHDITTFSYGMHTNTQHGGFKRDLTPLLFGNPTQPSIIFTLPKDSKGKTIKDVANHNFKTTYGIIPGSRHAVVSSTYDGLRNWGLKKYLPELNTGKISAETYFEDSSVKLRDPSKWARGISDGYAIETSRWYVNSPKIHPVMTEASWHIGLSYTGLPPDSKLRFHLSPKVVLWNPYSVALKMPKMAVLMPNAFKKYNNSGIKTSDDTRIKFLITDNHAEDLKLQLSNISKIASWPKVTEYRNSIGGGTSAKYYSFGVNSEVLGASSWAPRNKYLAFELEATEFKPGQCLIFSPLVNDDEAIVSQSDTNLKFYDETNLSSNLLSARSQFGYDHFIRETEVPGTQVRIGSLRASNELNVNDSKAFLEKLDFREVFRYRMTGSTHYNPHAILKVSKSGSFDVSGDSLLNSNHYPTLQTVNCGQAGTNGGEIKINNIFAENVDLLLEDSNLNPRIRFPRRYQAGIKMTWLDETYYEANNQESYRLHPTTGLKSNDSVFFKQAAVAYGNVRPSIVTKAPHQFVYASLYAYGAGTWMASYASPTPSEDSELPLINSEGFFPKNPFGSVSQHDPYGQAVMFDLPHQEYGTLSVASLRHAHVSPYSWHPTYVIGNSIAPLSAPSDSSANSVLETIFKASSNTETTVTNSFDYWLGGLRTPNSYLSDKKRYWKYFSPSSKVTWGAGTGTNINYKGFTNNETLLSIGSEKVSKSIDGIIVDSEDEILDYDISFEINHNIFDSYFLSGMPFNANQTNFDWNISEPTHQNLFFTNTWGNFDLIKVKNNLESNSEGLSYGFWNNGYLLASKAQFNVNSTSVDAWITVLSGMRNIIKKSSQGDIGSLSNATGFHVISRVKRPLSGDSSDQQNPSTTAPFNGARILTDEEIRKLAECVVYEVKARGPFLSLSDFVNRRLTTNKDPHSKNGALESALTRSGLNSTLEISNYDTTQEIGTRTTSAGRYDYSVAPQWRPDYTRQVKSRTWGLPSHLTQADILTLLAPNISVRGDTFTIRTYGQSLKNGKIMAQAFLEAIVVRTPNYVEFSNPDTPDYQLLGTNRSLQPAIRKSPSTGGFEHTNLSTNNRQYGRKFIVISKKWLSKNEI